MKKKEKRLLRKPKVLDKTGLCNSTLYYFISEGMFPSPVKLGKKAVAWREEAVDLWIASREIALPKTKEA